MSWRMRAAVQERLSVLSLPEALGLWHRLPASC
jgi:hypothetical protein